MDKVSSAMQAKDAAAFVEALVGSDVKQEQEAQEDQMMRLLALKDLLQASVGVVGQRVAALSKERAVSQSGGDTLLQIDNVQCFEPRGRFNMTITSSAILLQGKAFAVSVPISSVVQVIRLPSSASAKKEGEDLLALRLSCAVKLPKDSTTLLLNLSRMPNPTAVAGLGLPPMSLTLPSSEGGNLGTLNGNGSGPADSEANLVVRAVRTATTLAICEPQPSLFTSARESKPFLRCYRGTQEGAIYPLQGGVVFVKPLLIIPAEQIASLTAGRGGCGNTRYVDLLIETVDEKVFEFTNIDRDELPALQTYVKGYLEDRARREKAQ
ncbi:hypothetical protein B484DRAFT_396668, partial [Ochromonadaceae sp. CCMP2298]